MMINNPLSSSEPPLWLQQFVKHVIHAINPIDLAPPMGCHFFYNADSYLWEITLFAAKTEIVGGSQDGKINGARLGIDLLVVQNLFNHIDEYHWQTQPVSQDDELRSHISILGTVADQSVWLRLCAEAPLRFPPGRYVRVDEEIIEDIW